MPLPGNSGTLSKGNVQVHENGLTANESIGRIREAAEEIHNRGYDLGALSGE